MLGCEKGFRDLAQHLQHTLLMRLEKRLLRGITNSAYYDMYIISSSGLCTSEANRGGFLKIGQYVQ